MPWGATFSSGSMGQHYFSTGSSLYPLTVSMYVYLRIRSKLIRRLRVLKPAVPGGSRVARLPPLWIDTFESRRGTVGTAWFEASGVWYVCLEGIIGAYEGFLPGDIIGLEKIKCGQRQECFDT